jgi:outer membrane protein assembly factor BamB
MRQRALTLALALLVVMGLALAARADDWPQWMGPQRDDVWRETGILAKFPEGGPKVLWRVNIAGGYAGPAVAEGRVYVHDYQTDADIRKASNIAVRSKIAGKERVLCLDAKTGDLLWKQEYDCPYTIQYPAGPRCTPTVRAGKVYTLGSEGDLYCFDAAKGTILWSKSLKKEYNVEAPIWGFCSHPLIDGKKLFTVAGGDGSVAVCFDKDTGKELWKALSAKEPGYCPPTLLQAGGKRQLLIWHAESINSLDPETGQRYWEVPLKPSYGMSISAPRRDGDLLYAGGIGSVSACLRLAADKPAAEVVWRGERNNAVYPANSTPFLQDGVIYASDCHNGAFRGVSLADGKRLWETFAPTAGKSATHGTAFIVKNGDRFFLFSDTGDLIIAKLSPKGYEEISRARILDPTGVCFGRDVVWSHPAFAGKCCFARNDKEIVCVSLAAEGH